MQRLPQRGLDDQGLTSLSGTAATHDGGNTYANLSGRQSVRGVRKPMNTGFACIR
jgi:hypothetical protein